MKNSSSTGFNIKSSVVIQFRNEIQEENIRVQEK